MERPVMSSELAVLARLLVRMSRGVNRKLGLEDDTMPSNGLLHRLRVKGIRVNLRPLAEVQTLVLVTLAALILCSLATVVKACI